MCQYTGSTIGILLFGGFDIDITEDVLLDQEYSLILEKYYERCHIQKERLRVYYP